MTNGARRRAFIAAAVVLDLNTRAAAERLGISYNHLLLVLDGTRKGSEGLEAGIRMILDEAKPGLRAIIDGAYDAPGRAILLR